MTAEVTPAQADLSNRCPTVRIQWDAAKVGITGTEVAARLDSGTPRIVLAGPQGHRPDMMQSSIGVTSYMLEAGEEKIIADALYEILTKPGTFTDPKVPFRTSRRGEGNLGRDDSISPRHRRPEVHSRADGKRRYRRTPR